MAKTLIDYDRELSYLDKLPLRRFSKNSEYLHTGRKWIIENLLRIDQKHPGVIKALLGIIENSGDCALTYHYAADILGKIDPENPKAIEVLVDLISTTDETLKNYAIESLGEVGKGNPNAVDALVQVISSSTLPWTLSKAVKSLQKILTTPKQYAGVVSALKDYLSDEVYENNFDRFEASYEVIWKCAENLSYTQFYQAWHHSPTTPDPEVTDQTPNNCETSFAPINLTQSLQNQSILILNTQLLATETRESEIALTLSELIWDTTCPDEDSPEPATPAELRRALKKLQRRQLLPHRALLLTDCEHPTPKLISFCAKLTGVIAVAFLTDDPLEALLSGS